MYSNVLSDEWNVISNILITDLITPIVKLEIKTTNVLTRLNNKQKPKKKRHLEAMCIRFRFASVL